MRRRKESKKICRRSRKGKDGYEKVEKDEDRWENKNRQEWKEAEMQKMQRIVLPTY